MFRNLKKPSPSIPAIVAITPSKVDQMLLRRVADRAGWQLTQTEGLEDAERIPLASIVLFDRDLPGIEWREAVRRLADRQCRVILASFVVDDYLWEEVIRQGGYDVLPKPFREDEVLHTVQFAWAALTKSLPSAPRTG